MESLALQLLNQFDRHISARILSPGEGFTGLHCAAYFGLEEIAATLVERRGWDMLEAGYQGYTTLAWAARNRHEKIVKLLLAQSEVNPDSLAKNSVTPLQLASRRGHEGVVKLLLA